ncbi:MAG TPA: ABC transporter ATP-binding protein [Opitutales bacterium]|jgi:ABC-2 type transport system ATP-binding protein|nr:ABC transporter ATP-binding protein [Opitutales bacterium]
MNVIETHQLSRRFGRLEAVHGLDLVVPKGVVFALLGPNGAGKSTTIKMLMNLLPSTSGTAQVLGVDSRKLSPRELARIGYVAESMDLPEWMTVRQFLDYCRPFYPTWDTALEKKLLADFELPEPRKLKHLSRGMRMKTALIAALAYHPELLILDEPFSGLDPVVRDDFTRGLIEVSAQGEWTIFVSSHDIEDIERLADWIGVIENGRLRFAEELESLQRRFRRIEVTRASTTPAPQTRPATWLNYEESGLMARFIDSDYAVGDTEKRCADIFPGGTVTATPVPLREIYVTLAHASRGKAA